MPEGDYRLAAEIAAFREQETKRNAGTLEADFPRVSVFLLMDWERRATDLEYSKMAKVPL
jgi:hypothetical protein